MEMKINRNNYESFFLDYLEGNLEDGRMEEFHEFIRKNPDLGEELYHFDKLILREEKQHFGKKEQLYKEELDHQTVFDHAVVAWMEGDLNPEQILSLRNYLEKHPDRNKEMELFMITRLIPDPSLQFPAKKSLYRISATRKLVIWGTRMAAVFLLAWGVYALLQQPWSLPEKEMTTASRTFPLPGKLPVQPGQLSTEDPPVINGQTENKPAFSGDRKTGNDTEVKQLTYTNTLEKYEQKKGFTESAAGNADPGLPEKSDKQSLMTPRYFVPAEIPELLSPIRGTLYTPAENEMLAHQPGFPLPETGNLQQSLAASKNTKQKRLNAGKILLVGILAAEDLSNDKFNVKTNRQGNIIGWEIDTRFLGLSVPVRKKE